MSLKLKYALRWHEDVVVASYSYHLKNKQKLKISNLYLVLSFLYMTFKRALHEFHLK